MKNKIDISKVYSVNFDFTFANSVIDAIDEYACSSFGRSALAQSTKESYAEKALNIYSRLLKYGFSNVERIYNMHYSRNPGAYVSLVVIALMQIAENINREFDASYAIDYFSRFLLNGRNADLMDIISSLDKIIDMPKSKPEISIAKKYLHEVKEVLEMYKEWGDEQERKFVSVFEDNKTLKDIIAKLRNEKETLEVECNNLRAKLSSRESDVLSLHRENTALQNQIELYKHAVVLEEAKDRKKNKENLNAALKEVGDLKSRLTKEIEEHGKTKDLLNKANDKLSNNKKEEIEQQVKLQEIERMVDKAKRMHSWEEAKPIYDFLINTYRGSGEEVFGIIDKIDEHFNKKYAPTKIISKKTNIKLEGDANFHSQANIDTFIDNNGTVNNKK